MTIVYAINMVSRKIQQTNRGQYVMTLPAGVVEGLGWKKGDTIEIGIGAGGKIELKNAK